MSAKLRGLTPGQPPSELTKLKLLWLSAHFADSSRDYWREQFVSARTQADLRKELQSQLRINLASDKQLTAFRSWLDDQDARDRQAERMAENERRLKAEHPDWSLDQVREEVLKQSYFETLAIGDWKLGLKTVAADVRVKTIALDARRVALLEQKASQADATKKVLGEKKLTPEERDERIREIYGMK
jgi:hypothetical protein